jgi:enamine deaminase RidA (YjgF/YER057c/UK114 family)
MFESFQDTRANFLRILRVPAHVARAMLRAGANIAASTNVPAFARHSTKGHTMKNLQKTALMASLAGALLCGAASTVSAAEIERLYGPNAMSPIASAVSVPPGYTTFYVSGALPNPVTPAADGKPADFGDITAQTRSVLDNLKAVMEKQGIGFGDVVAAHVFLDPKADFMAMNKVWATEFGTAAQPNKPARAAMRVNALVLPGALLEIEFIAAKKMPTAKKK